MTKYPAISVVIPMYNAEKFIGECLESLLAQTFQDFEVIIVDDCSTDNSVAVVENYAPNFNGRLKLSRLEKNCGTPAVPRNRGLKLSRGEYVFFADADDLFTLTSLEELYTLAKNFDADVVYCERYYRISSDFKKVYTATDQKGTLVKIPTFETDDLAQRVKNILCGQFWLTPWLKFTRRDLLIENEIFFPSTRTSQDDIWTYGLIFYAKKFLRVPNIVYIYRESENSIQRTTRLPKERIRFLLNPIVFGVKALDKFMSRLEFFRENLRYRYGMLEFFIHSKLGPALDSSLEVQPFEIYDEIQQEFGKSFGEHDILISCLLADLLEQQKIFVADRKKIAELEAQINNK